MGALRTARTLLKLNQRNGFDRPGCAWPETPGHRKHAEFCENGAKAVAEEATTRIASPSFFAAHPVNELLDKTDYWLGQQGRLTHPMILLSGSTHYQPIGWDAAFGLIADELRALAHPDEAVFYTSGRTANEGGVPLPVDDSGVRHQQHAGLLEHMPRDPRTSVPSLLDIVDHAFFRYEPMTVTVSPHRSESVSSTSCRVRCVEAQC